MLESVQHLIGDFFGRPVGTAHDGRKREHGDLRRIKARATMPRYCSDSNKAGERNSRRSYTLHSTEGNSEYTRREDRPMDHKYKVVKPVRKLTRSHVSEHTKAPKSKRRFTLSGLYEALKSVFTNDDQTLNLMQRTCGNADELVSRSRLSKEHEERYLRNRISSSRAFKKKLSEINYDRTMLEKLRESGKRLPLDSSNMTMHRKWQPSSESIEDDRIRLLELRCSHKDEQLKTIKKELEITKRKLEFAKEKNTILKAILNDANVDSDYVKSRRDIKNLQTDNLKPQEELPPSPVRTVNPLFTSSPVRKTQSQEDTISEKADGKQDTYYNKYPKIPETENLARKENNESMSPIRVDYTKYSSPRSGHYD